MNTSPSRVHMDKKRKWWDLLLETELTRRASLELIKRLTNIKTTVFASNLVEKETLLVWTRVCSLAELKIIFGVLCLKGKQFFQVTLSKRVAQIAFQVFLKVALKFYPLKDRNPSQRKNNKMRLAHIIHTLDSDQKQLLCPIHGIVKLYWNMTMTITTKKSCAKNFKAIFLDFSVTQP